MWTAAGGAIYNGRSRKGVAPMAAGDDSNQDSEVLSKGLSATAPNAPDLLKSALDSFFFGTQTPLLYGI